MTGNPAVASATPVEIAASLRAAVDAALPRLSAISSVRSQERPSRGKWSPREIVGHLIDSAQNNHGRFVRAQLSDDLRFAGYAQDEWVAIQGYQDAPWEALVELWAAYNRQLARVIERVPPGIAAQSRTKHNLHEVAWRAVPASEPASLGYFMLDYVGHLQHHLRQVDALLGYSTSLAMES